MATLETLVKIREQELETRQKELVKLEESFFLLKEKIRMLEENLERQRQLAMESPLLLGRGYAGFFRQVEEKRKALLDQEKALEKEIELKRDEILLVFGDKKSLEHVWERNLLQAKKEEERIKQSQTDEWVNLAYIRARRNK